MIECGLTLTKRKHLDILKAAVELFQLYGFENTNMDAIAVKAKVSKRTIYKHFSDKNALFQAILKELLGQVLTLAEYPYKPNIPLDKQLIEIATLYVEFLTSECVVKVTRVVLIELIRSPKKAAKVFVDFNEEELCITKWLVAAKKDKKIKTMDETFASKQFLGLLKAAVFWPHIIEGKPIPNKNEKKIVIKKTVSFFLNNYQIND